MAEKWIGVLKLHVHALLVQGSSQDATEGVH